MKRFSPFSFFCENGMMYFFFQIKKKYTRVPLREQEKYTRFAKIPLRNKKIYFFPLRKFIICDILK